MLRNTSFQNKLLLAFAVVSTFLVIVGGINYWALSRVTSRYEHVAKINLGNTVTLSQMRGAMYDMRVQVNKLANPTTPPEEIPGSFAAIENDRKAYAAADTLYRSIEFVPGEQVLYDEVDKRFKEVMRLHDTMVQFAQSPTDKGKVATVLNGDYRPAAKAFIGAIGALIEFQDAESIRWADDAENTAKRAEVFGVIVIVSGVLLAMALGYLLSKGLMRGVQLVIRDLDTASSQTLSASEQVSASSQALAQGASEQAGGCRRNLFHAGRDRQHDPAERGQRWTGRAARPAGADQHTQGQRCHDSHGKRHPEHQRRLG